MAKPSIQSRFPAIFMKVACVFLLIVLPILAESELISSEIKGVTKLNTLDMIQLNSNYTIDILTDFDTRLSVDQYKILFTRIVHKKRIAVDNLWPGGNVEYEMEPSVSDDIKASVRKAVGHWMMYTCLNFTETNVTSYGIHFIKTDSFWSYLGRMNFHRQSIGIGGTSTGSSIHVIGHTLGLIHEHSRSDRDKYIRVNLNPNNKLVYGLLFKQSGYVNDYGVGYDYLSVMHYPSFGMITTLDPKYQDRIGNRYGLSFKDIKLANLMYNCHNVKGKCSTKTCPFNGMVFFKPFKDQPACECFCDSGDVKDPLVPCSSITQEANVYNLTLSDEGSSMSRPLCFDLLSNCGELQAEGLCQSEPTSMLLQCTKTCVFCGKGDNLCADYSRGCGLMAASCKDLDLKEMMSEMCPRTCKNCTDLDSMCDIQETLNEQ